MSQDHPAPARWRSLQPATVVWLTRSAFPAANVLPVRATARKYRRSFQSSMSDPDLHFCRTQAQ